MTVSAHSTTTPTDAGAPAPTSAQKLAAEAIGTFVLVFLGCGSVVLASLRSGPLFEDPGGSAAVAFSALPSVVSIGLTFGLAVMVMVYAFGRVSGGHFNPAVTLGAVVSGRLPWRQVPLYVGAQLGGAVLGAGALLVVAMGFEDYEAFDTTLGANGWGDDGTGYALWAALLLEFLLTIVLVHVILAVTDERNEHPALAPLAIGLTLAAIHFVAIPATGTSVNPARSLGPALFSGTDPLAQVWVFLLAPVLGGLVAGVTYPLLFGRSSDPVPGSGFRSSRPAAAVPGYGAPDAYQQQWNQQDAATTATAGQPIVQDGWQWDPVAQQWIPAQQPYDQPAQPAQQWPSEPSGQQTQIRPPEGG